MRQAAATNRSRRNDAMMGNQEVECLSHVLAKQNTQEQNGQLLRQLNATTISLICFPDTRTAMIHYSKHCIINGCDMTFECNDLFLHRVHIIASRERELPICLLILEPEWVLEMIQ